MTGGGYFNNAADMLRVNGVKVEISGDDLIVAPYRRSPQLGLRAAPLLHLATRPDAWEQWFAMNGVAADGVHGMLLDQFAMVAQAAIASMGLALLPDFLIAEELASGVLVTALDRPMQSAGAYWLVWPQREPPSDRHQAFADWLREEARRYQAEQPPLSE